jgi:hypothetical protein
MAVYQCSCGAALLPAAFDFDLSFKAGKVNYCKIKGSEQNLP